jgi:hypothetical protein
VVRNGSDVDLFHFSQRIAGITAVLQQSLEGLLLEGLQTSNVDIVRHCLRTYATIDKTRDAEALVGQVLVKPCVDEVCVPRLMGLHRAAVDSWLPFAGCGGQRQQQQWSAGKHLSLQDQCKNGPVTQLVCPELSMLSDVLVMLWLRYHLFWGG